MLKGMAANVGKDPTPPDLSHPSMRSWIEGVGKGSGRVGPVRDAHWWLPGSAAKTILGKLQAAGYTPAAKPERFMVKGRYGPLKDGELERAKAWGAEMAKALSGQP